MDIRQDPRPDLKADSEQWTRLLINAEAFCTDLTGILHGLRCLGARIVSAGGKWRLANGQIPEAEWAKYKAELAPHAGRLVWLLQVSELGQAMDDRAVDGLPVRWRESGSTPAWVVINSAVLDDLIIVLLDPKHRKNAEKRGMPIYTAEEVQRLKGQPKEALMAYHQEKVAKQVAV